jgi:hypothetical protein
MTVAKYRGGVARPRGRSRGGTTTSTYAAVGAGPPANSVGLIIARSPFIIVGPWTSSGNTGERNSEREALDDIFMTRRRGQLACAAVTGIVIVARSAARRCACRPLVRATTRGFDVDVIVDGDMLRVAGAHR